MDVKVASLAGFCFGVKRAVDTVEGLIKNGSENIYTLGNLIHNPTIISRLEKNGVKVIDNDRLDEIFKKTNESNPCTVVVRAHGVTKDISEKLERFSKENRYFNFVDCTCPHVKKIHKIVSEHSSSDVFTLVFGNRTHPEVIGICSYIKGEYFVFSDVAELEGVLPKDKSVMMVSQTTQNMSDWKNSIKFLKKLYTNALIFDTICSVTENRQKEVEHLSKECDLVFVIGGHDSSNTNKLFEISKSNQPNTYLIEDAKQIPPVDITTYKKIGIAAGASTPGDIIEEVTTTMSEKEITHNEANENFAQMLDSTFKTITTGDVVEGIVTGVNENEVTVDLGNKVTGFINANDLMDPTVKLTDKYSVGDTITAKAVRVSDVDGFATLSRRTIEAGEQFQSIVDAYKEGTVLQGKVTEAVNGGVIMILNSVKVFVPASQTGLPKDADLNAILGQIKKAKIIDVNEQRKRAVGSIKAVERAEKKAKEEEFWNTVEEGQKFTGKVKSLTNYGAFVNLGPVDGMVHVSELTWQRIKHPKDAVSVGDTLDVFITKLDKDKKRISLGCKTAETNPWLLFTNQFNQGDEVNVKIRSLMPYGAFAEIIPGVDGLIHISQITNEKRLSNPSEALKVGEIVKAVITEVDEEKQKVNLSIKKLYENDETEATETVEETVEEVVEAPVEETADAPAEETQE